MTLDARRVQEPTAAAALALSFIAENRISVLNVAGPRMSGWAEGYAFALQVVAELIAKGSNRT
jgi:hypothetical protein